MHVNVNSCVCMCIYAIWKSRLHFQGKTFSVTRGRGNPCLHLYWLLECDVTAISRSMNQTLPLTFNQEHKARPHIYSSMLCFSAGFNQDTSIKIHRFFCKIRQILQQHKKKRQRCFVAESSLWLCQAEEKKLWAIAVMTLCCCPLMWKGNVTNDRLVCLDVSAWTLLRLFHTNSTAVLLEGHLCRFVCVF